MKFKLRTLSLITCIAAPFHLQAAIMLTGNDLTVEQAISIAHGEEVTIAPEAKRRVEQGYQLLMVSAREGKKIYGLTVGVGLNKDKSLFNASGKLSDEVLNASHQFNINTLRAHQAGIKPYMPTELVRLAMAIRLNTVLTGYTGAQWHVAELYQDFLNKNITPLVPSNGSVGEADITLASHIGAVMIGEWKTNYQGSIISGKDALNKAGLVPLEAKGKDALAIISNNALSIAYTIQAAKNAEQLLKVSPTLFAMSLEALNGNIAPILPQTISIRPFRGLEPSAKEIRNALDGSYLWQKDFKRPLQDPLSFRTTVYTLAEANNALKDLKDALQIQINHSDDNPAVILKPSKDYQEQSQVNQYMTSTKGAVIPTANFEALPIALAVERLSLALTHVAHNSIQRTIHLSDDHFTGLTRFAAARNNNGHAFGAIQKPFIALQSENMQLAIPVSFYGQPMAGTIEDTYSNNLLASKNLLKIVKNTQYIYGLELLHAAQLFDIRRQDNIDIPFGKRTNDIYKSFREIIPFVEHDRSYSPDIEASRQFIATYKQGVKK
ncbi:TPA: HAL/PAL/TAL family ammonia-lyase [Photobacterium damselae]